MLPCVLIGALLGNELGTLLMAGLLGHTPRLLVTGSLRGALVGASFVMLVSLLVMLFFYSRERLNKLELERAGVLRQAAEALLTALQAPLEPHMLFNTLAHLRALIKLRPDDAQAMLDELIAYLRATLQASRTPEHPLQTEFARLADYLKLMQRRMGPRLQVAWERVEPLPWDLPMPRLVLQPLVENAVLHGISRLAAGGRIDIGIAREGAVLRIAVANPAPASAAPGAGGNRHAQRSIGHRLAYAFGPEARMTTCADAGYYRVELRLPIPKGEAAE